MNTSYTYLHSSITVCTTLINLLVINQAFIKMDNLQPQLVRYNGVVLNIVRFRYIGIGIYRYG